MIYESKLNIKSWAEEDRPREKFHSKGKSSLSDAELIAILIGSGSRDETAVDLARRILASVNHNLNQLGKLGVDYLKKFKGIGEAKAITIAAALELGRRRSFELEEDKPFIKSSSDAFKCINSKLTDLPHEEFWILLLNKANQLMEAINISKGGVSATIADAKLIFKPALEKLASSIILCHNHPSGNLKASEADKKLTVKIKEGAKNLDIAVLDHIIVANNSYFSFADEGLM